MEGLRQHLGIPRSLRIRVERHGGETGDEHHLDVRVELASPGAPARCRPSPASRYRSAAARTAPRAAGYRPTDRCRTRRPHSRRSAAPHQEAAHVVVVFGEKDLHRAVSPESSANGVDHFMTRLRVNNAVKEPTQLSPRYIVMDSRCRSLTLTVHAAFVASEQPVILMRPAIDRRVRPRLRPSIEPPAPDAALRLQRPRIAGASIPPPSSPPSRLDAMALRRSEDAFVDELFARGRRRSARR